MDLPSQETTRFVLAHLPFGARTVIEVGCGRGEVAALLASAGLQVVAVDADAEAVAAARARGVDARVARWPEFASGRYDAVLFTRSLHHLPALGPTLERACQLLTPTGRVLVEDFAFQDVDLELVRWFVTCARDLDRGTLRRDVDCFARRLLAAADPVGTWLGEHAHDLHTVAAMRAALAARLAVIDAAEAPYFYRYLVPLVPDDPHGVLLLHWVRTQEEQFARTGRYAMLGRRFVARVPPAPKAAGSQ